MTVTTTVPLHLKQMLRNYRKMAKSSLDGTETITQLKLDSSLAYFIMTLSQLNKRKKKLK